MNASHEAAASRETLAGVATGKHLVATAAGSTYLLDLDERTIIRLPRADEDAELRRDGHPVTLLAILECSVGTEMVLLIDLAVPGVAFTTRRTTTVTTLRQLA